MKNFPYISLHSSLKILRIAIAIFFMTHAISRIVYWTIPQFGAFMERQGFPFGIFLVWIITLYEIVAGSCIIMGYKTKYFATGLFIIAATGIWIIHRHFGWFVGEHGTGGSEYSVSLMVSLLVIAAADRNP